jgi:hypothetical protein
MLPECKFSVFLAYKQCCICVILDAKDGVDVFLWFHLFVLFLRFVLGVYLMLFVFYKKETSKNIVFL